MRKQFITAAVLLAVGTTAFAASNRPSGYTTICKTNQTCSVSSTTNVAFGAAGRFVYKTLNGSFVCNTSTFGSDPNPSKSVKECSIPSGGSSSSTTTSTSTSSSSSTTSSSSSSSSNNCGSGANETVCLSAAPGSNDIDLTWTVSGSISRAYVYRDTDSNPSGRTRLASLSGSARTYSDTNASSGTKYWYWIKFVASNGSQYNSGAASATYNGGSSSSSTTSSSSSSSSSGTPSSECVAGKTISGKTIDCAGKKLALSCKGDSETQPPILTLKNATVKNLVISASGASDGIHCTGNCTMQNVVWEDICEDAATNKSDGVTMTIIGGSAFNSATSGYGGKPDKVFQHNSKNSTTVVKGGFTLTGEHGKLWRSCGNCTNNGGPRYVKIDGVNINAKIGSIAGVNGNYGDKATIRNLKIKNYQSGSPKVCEEYVGVEKGKGESKKIGEKWNTSSCDVSKSDISAL